LPKVDHLIKELKADFHSAAFKKFLTLFHVIVTQNHDKMDTTPLESIPQLQGQNLLLKKLIKDLTTNREIKYPGM